MLLQINCDMGRNNFGENLFLRQQLIVGETLLQEMVINGDYLLLRPVY